MLKLFKIRTMAQIFLMVYTTCVSYLQWDLKFIWPYRCSLLDLFHWFNYNIFFLASLTGRHWCYRWWRSCSVCNPHLLENRTWLNIHELVLSGVHFRNHFMQDADVFLNAQNKYTVQHPYSLICNLTSWLNFFALETDQRSPKMELVISVSQFFLV